MTRNELAKALYQAAYLTGTFTLRSGQTSHEYFDKYRFESSPLLLSAIAEVLAPMIPKDTELLAGLEMGGIPIATALSLKTGIPAIFVRKKAKPYGTCRVAEGTEFAGKKVLMIEDVITTGGQVLLSAADLRKEGAVVSDVLCVLRRGEPQGFEEAKLRLQHAFTMDDLKAAH